MGDNLRKILICEDSITVRKKLKESILKSGDFEIIEATDGESAVEMYKQNRPDLVFMDIVMPKKDGTVATKEIREYDDTAKVVIVSSLGTKDNLKKILTYGAKDFIQKPWEDSHVSNIIEELVLKGE